MRKLLYGLKNQSKLAVGLQSSQNFSHVRFLEQEEGAKPTGGDEEVLGGVEEEMQRPKSKQGMTLWV